MKLFTKLAATAGLALSMMGSAHADVVLNNWQFNPLGTGVATAQTINEFLNVNGNAFIELTGKTATTFNFIEHAAFNIVQADGNGQLFPLNYAGGNITATFEATGTGFFNGAFTFTGGTIRMFQNPTNNQYATTTGMYGADLGNEIAVFTVLPGGGGFVDGTGNPINTGAVNVYAKATSMDAGYFFKQDDSDMSFQEVMAFAFTNATGTQSPTANMVSEIACEFSGFCTGPYSNVPGDHFFVSNDGQFKLTQAVPEPGSLALFGIALLGAGVVSRKRAANKA
jgi:hypothetical protein